MIILRQNNYAVVDDEDARTGAILAGLIAAGGLEAANAIRKKNGKAGIKSVEKVNESARSAARFIERKVKAAKNRALEARKQRIAKKFVKSLGVKII